MCHDPLRQWNPESDTCYASADLAVHIRRQAKEHEKAKPNPEGRLPDDGVTLYVTPGEVVEPEG